MDSNNNANNKNTSELDIRDIANFLLSKIWIIALVILSFAIIAFLWTSFFVQKEYTSKTEMFIISATGTTSNTNASSNQINNWSIGKQLTKTSKDLIMGDYCYYVAEMLNEHNPDPSMLTGTNAVLVEALNDTVKNTNKPLPSEAAFSVFFSSFFGQDGITGDYIRSHISVNSDDETCIVSVTATTNDAKLSAAISNAVMSLFGDYINSFMDIAGTGEKTISTDVTYSGKVPAGPSNANATRNAIIFGAIGAVLVCAILIIIFIFDDKIKTPDDIEKYLGLSVLGAIPEIDEE